MIVHLLHVDLAMESLLLNSLKNQIVNSSNVHLFVIIKTMGRNHKANTQGSDPPMLNMTTLNIGA